MKKIDKKLQIFLKKRNFTHSTDTKQAGARHYTDEELDMYKKIYGEGYVKKLINSEVYDIEDNGEPTPEDIELLMKLDAADGRDAIESAIKELKKEMISVRNSEEQIERYMEIVKNICIFLAIVFGLYLAKDIIILIASWIDRY